MRLSSSAWRTATFAECEMFCALTVLLLRALPEFPMVVHRELFQLVPSQRIGNRRLCGAIKAKGTQAGKVERNEEVEVLLLDEFDDQVQTEQHARANEWELHRILLGNHLDLRVAMQSGQISRAAAGAASPSAPVGKTTCYVKLRRASIDAVLRPFDAGGSAACAHYGPATRQGP